MLCFDDGVLRGESLRSPVSSERIETVHIRDHRGSEFAGMYGQPLQVRIPAGAPMSKVHFLPFGRGWPDFRGVLYLRLALVQPPH